MSKIAPCQANFLSEEAFGSPPWNPQERREAVPSFLKGGTISKGYNYGKWKLACLGSMLCWHHCITTFVYKKWELRMYLHFFLVRVIYGDIWVGLCEFLDSSLSTRLTLALHNDVMSRLKSRVQLHITLLFGSHILAIIHRDLPHGNEIPSSFAKIRSLK
jgi:hypothetical protein